MASYFKIPFVFDTLLSEGHGLTICTLSESIVQNIELIIITKYGEHRNDPSFGCGIWDLDFDLMTNEDTWKERLRLWLLASINKHEPRLTNVELSIEISTLTKQYPFDKFPEIKKSVTIAINGTINKTGSPFSLSTNLYLSPLAKN